MQFVLLPGLDGTGLLFEPFLQQRPEGVEPRVISYPGREQLSYLALRDFVQRRLPTDEPFVLVGESFSGPLAISLASQPSPLLTGLVLVASFARRPFPRWLANLVWQAWFQPPLVRRAIRWLLLSGRSNEILDSLIDRAIADVGADVLAYRVRELLRVDVTDDLRSVRTRILSLQAASDRIVWRHNLRHIQQTAPQVTVKTLPTPHLMLQTAPADCWSEIMAWGRGGSC